MNRSKMLVGALCMGLIACSITGAPGPEQTEEPAAPSGGVPISKATSTQLESAPSSTPVPQPPTEAPAPIATATSSAPQPQGQDVPLEIIDLNPIEEDGLGVRVYGLMRNIGQQDLGYVQITVQFLNANGAITNTRFGLMASLILPAGEVAPFDIRFPEGVDADATDVRVEYFWSAVGPSNEWQRGGMEVINTSATLLPNISAQVSGEVRNNSAVRMKQVRVMILAYDAQGHYLAHVDFQSEEGFDPGESVAFERPILLYQQTDAVADYEFIVETWPEP